MQTWYRYVAAALLTAGSVSLAPAQVLPWPAPPVTGYRHPGWDARVRLVTEWYRKYLRRDPDPAGFYGWVNQVDLAYPQKTLAGILGSDEYYRNCGGRDDLFIRGLFNDVVGRQPFPRDVRFWLRALDHSGSRQQTALEFLNYTGSGARY